MMSDHSAFPQWINKYLLFSLLVLVLWKIILFIVFPFPGIDGVWSLSHTLSILRGNFFKSEFGHSFLEVFNYPYLFGLINVPFYARMIFGVYQIFVVSTVFIVLL